MKKNEIVEEDEQEEYDNNIDKEKRNATKKTLFNKTSKNKKNKEESIITAKVLKFILIC